MVASRRGEREERAVPQGWCGTVGLVSCFFLFLFFFFESAFLRFSSYTQRGERGERAVPQAWSGTGEAISCGLVLISWQ